MFTSIVIIIYLFFFLLSFVDISFYFIADETIDSHQRKLIHISNISFVDFADFHVRRYKIQIFYLLRNFFSPHSH